MKSEYYEFLEQAVKKYGGLFNAHLHLDRAGTLQRKYLKHMSMDPIEASSYSLKVKQNLTGDLHRGPAYEKEDLKKRMQQQLDIMIQAGTKRADSFIDVSSNNVGLTAIEKAIELNEKNKDKIDLIVGAYPIFGFKESESEREDLFEQAAERADYIGNSL